MSVQRDRSSPEPPRRPPGGDGVLRSILDRCWGGLGALVSAAGEPYPPRLAGAAAATRVAIFTRYPLPGRAKTRLIPALGATGAARLQRRLTERTVAEMDRLGAGVDVEVRFEGGDERRMRRWLGSRSRRFVRQGAGDLGAKMRRALEAAFWEGCGKAVIVGSDCPALSAEHVRKALRALDRHDLVLGPSGDGGYWLIGVARPIDVFRGVPWGTSRVLSRTLEQAGEQGLSVTRLETLEDIDSPADLRHAPRGAMPHGPWLSVIIPALDEAARIERCVASVRDEAEEVIVVDGGSEDDTPDLAAQAGARVIAGRPGRARQMNLGARAATGEVLMFLHADTVPQRGFASAIFDATSDRRVVGGALTFAAEHSGRAMRWIERLVAVRSRRLAMPYGDQGLFARSEAFDEAGGFPDRALGEDWHFVRSLRRLGRLAILPHRAVTSARRWRRVGLWRATWINQLVVAGLLLGVPDAWLARLYRGAGSDALSA